MWAKIYFGFLIWHDKEYKYSSELRKAFKDTREAREER